MNDWLTAIVADLRDAAGELLRPGISAAQALDGAAEFSADPLWLVQAISGLMPKLLAELDPVESSELAAEPSAFAMRRPRMSTRVSDHAMVEGRLLPVRWLELRPVPSVDETALSWLLFVVDTVREEFASQLERLDHHVQGALAARGGDSTFGREDVASLERFEGSHHDAMNRLLRARRAVLAAAGARLQPRDRAPRPFPRSPAWTMLRRLADVLQRPHAYLASHLRHALQHTNIAALPFLYQRWVGWRLVLALQSMGFRAVNEPIGCLFLGGAIRLRTDDLEVSLWCEPRLLRAAHPSGLRASTREAQPDYVLVFPGHGGIDAFVLDATLASSRTAQKARYREGIEIDATRTIAGVPVRRGPLRAWAAAPTATPHCDLHSPDGSTGTIPMLPGRFADGPLRAWLQDAIDHARAWSAVAMPTG